MHRRAGFMCYRRYLIFCLPWANLEGRVERYNALSVLVNFVKVQLASYNTPILLVLRAFLHSTGGHFTDEAFRLCSLYYSVHHS